MQPSTSATLTKDNKVSGYEFLDQLRMTMTLVTAIMSVIHPEQYAAGMRMNGELMKIDELKEVFAHWPSCFTAMQVIANRVSPLHLDPGTPYSAFDALATVGNFTGGHIKFPTLPIDIDQRPGSIAAFAGHLLPHEVTEFKGDRVSFAWFLKDAVASWVETAVVPWCRETDVRRSLAI